MASTGSITLKDYDGNTGVVGFHTAEITAANFAGMTSAIEDLEDAVEAVTTGLVIQNELSSIRRKANSKAKSGDATSQRGNKWLVTYMDNTAEIAVGTPNAGYLKIFDVEIPTADLSMRIDNENDVYDAGLDPESEIPEFITLADELNSIMRSPYGGVALVLKIEAVTRSGG